VQYYLQDGAAVAGITRDHNIANTTISQTVIADFISEIALN